MALEYLKLDESNSIRIAAADLHKQVSAILQGVGTPLDHAEITAKILVSASLRGVDTHGVGNAVRYSISIEDGTYTIPQTVEAISETDTTVLLSCGNGLGFVAAHQGMEMSIAKAREFGLGMATIRDGHHIGMVGYYPMMATQNDMIGMAMTNANQAVRPALGARPRVGTNPIAFGAPSGDERDFILDMATSTVASGKIGLARRLGVQIPEGWAVTAGIAGTIIGGLIADKFGARRIASLFAVLTGLSIFTIALAEDLWQNRTVMTWLIVIYPFFGAAMGISLISLFMNVTWPKVGATQFTLYMALLNFGALFGLKMAGYFEENFTYTTTIMIGGSCQLLIAFVLPFIDPGQTRRELGNEF